VTDVANQKNLCRPRFLEGQRVFLTPLAIEDLDKNLIWDNDPEMSFLDGGSHRPKTREVARDEFEKTLKKPDSMFFTVIRIEDGEQIGSILLYDVHEYERWCHWGIKLDKKHWRQGYGTEAALLLLNYVFADLGFNRLKSDTHLRNEASWKFQESLGFLREGVMRQDKYIAGEYVDDVLYGMLRSEYLELYGAS
jgi:RimJ/RimL family protein N-acetyltransferase